MLKANPNSLPPRILAVQDIRLVTERSVAESLVSFYVNILGLRECGEKGNPTAQTTRLMGHPVSGPRLIVEPVGERPPWVGYHRIMLQVADLAALAEVLTEQEIEYRWQPGGAFCDRRIELLDPAVNLLDIVSSHPL